jgi:hypothetical protein
MSKAIKDLPRSQKIDLLNRLKKGRISLSEFISEIAKTNHSAVFIQRGESYHVVGTDLFLTETEIKKYIDSEGCHTIAILPWKGDPLYDGENFIGWPEPIN